MCNNISYIKAVEGAMPRSLMRRFYTWQTLPDCIARPFNNFLPVFFSAENALLFGQAMQQAVKIYKGDMRQYLKAQINFGQYNIFIERPRIVVRGYCDGTAIAVDEEVAQILQYCLDHNVAIHLALSRVWHGCAKCGRYMPALGMQNVCHLCQSDETR